MASAAFVPGYSGGTATDSHRLPYSSTKHSFADTHVVTTSYRPFPRLQSIERRNPNKTSAAGIVDVILPLHRVAGQHTRSHFAIDQVNVDKNNCEIEPPFGTPSIRPTSAISPQDVVADFQSLLCFTDIVAKPFCIDRVALRRLQSFDVQPPKLIESLHRQLANIFGRH